MPLSLPKQFVFNFIVFVLLLIGISHNAYAESHQHHQRFGFHGMVLFMDRQDNIYASHLPLYSKPHDYQIIYQVQVPIQSQLITQLSKGMVTILPNKFDLNKLVNGESFSIGTDFYTGHFERGGKQFHNADIRFDKAIMIEPVNANYQSKSEEFFKVSVNKTTSLLVHKIQQAPSFDAIAIIDTKNALEKVVYRCDKPKELNEIIIREALSLCGIRNISYLETEDFSR